MTVNLYQMKVDEMKELVKEAVSHAAGAEALLGETMTVNAAQTGALISIAKSLAVIAGILEKATNGQASINVYDMSHPEI